MNVSIERPTTAAVRGRMEDAEGTAIGEESPALKTRIRELERTVADDAVITLARDWEDIAYAPIDGDDRLNVLYLLDDGRVGFGGINQPAFHPTIAAYLKAEDV